MKYVRSAVFGIIFFFFTMMLFFGSIPVWCYVMVFDSRRRLAMQWYSSFWSKIIYRLNPWWRVEVRGRENLDKSKTYLMLSNHNSMLDIPLLFYVPANFRWVSKYEVYSIPFFGWVLWMRGDVGIHRGGASGAKKMIKECTAFMREGISVFLFPEGTRSKTGQIGEFH
ncbi:MAG: lysophospholipid acyltransferase family protein, partial [Mucinivorans sp.]